MNDKNNRETSISRNKQIINNWNIFIFVMYLVVRVRELTKVIKILNKIVDFTNF